MRILKAALLYFAWLRQISICEYFEMRDPVSGAVYYFMLMLFALLPLWVARKVRKSSFQ